MQKLRLFLFLLYSGIFFTDCSFAQPARDSALHTRLDRIVTESMSEGDIPGLGLVVIDSGKLYIKAYGYSDIRTRTPVTERTLFQIGSCSKAFTALAIMELANEGRIDLNAAVSDYIPWFSVKFKDSLVRITPLQLLHHTSGIPWHTISDIPESNEANALEQTVRRVSGCNLHHLPGKSYEYATINYDILAFIAQKITNRPFEKYLEESVFDSLQLHHTTIGKPMDSSLLATGYKIGFFHPLEYKAPVYRGNDAAGYVITDVNDAARWLKLQMGLIDNALYPVAERTQQRDETVPLHDNMLSYAMGWEVSLYGNGQISHAGLNPNFTAFMAFRKNSHTGVVILANSNSGFTPILGMRIMRLMAKEKTVGEFKPTNGNDAVYSILSLVLGLYILAVIVFMIKLFLDILSIKRRYAKMPRNELYKAGFALIAVTPFLVGLYLLPVAMAGFSWRSAIVWSPLSFEVFVILAGGAIGISYMAFFLAAWFPDQNRFRKAAPKIALMSILSGIANIVLIVLITSAIGSGIRLRYLVFYYFLILFFYIFAQRFVQRSMTRFTVDLTYELKMRLIDRIFATSYQKFERIDRGRIYTALNDDVEFLGNAAPQIAMLITGVFTIIGAFMYLCSLAFWSAILTITLIAAITTVYHLIGKRAVKYFEAARDTRNVFVQLINGMVDGYKELNLHRKKKMEYKADIEESASTYRGKIFAASSRYITAYLIGESMLIFMLGVIVFVIPRLLPGAALYAVTSFLLVVLYLIGPVNGALRTVPVVLQMKVAWRRLKSFTADIPVSSDAGKTVQSIDGPIRSIRAENICFRYEGIDQQEGFEVGPVSLEVKHGEILFIIGGNGSGKTTLAMLLTGLYEPHEGRMLINDRAVTGSELSECFSAVFNPLFLFEKLYNIEVRGKSDLIKKHLAILNLDDKVEISGNKYSTISLSGGQRKRLALLQCYLEDSPIYLFDEWAADQDPEYRNFFYRTLLPEMKRSGKIVIGITHDDHYFDVADKVVKMQMGKLEPYLGERSFSPGFTPVVV